MVLGGGEGGVQKNFGVQFYIILGPFFGGIKMGSIFLILFWGSKPVWSPIFIILFLRSKKIGVQSLGGPKKSWFNLFWGPSFGGGPFYF